MTTAAAPSETVLLVPSLGSQQQSRMDFPDTTFFTRPSSARVSLPSPADVLARHKKNSQCHARVAVFEEVGLIVKFGRPPNVHLDDALTMRALRKAFPKGEIPIPEVFGWRVEKGINFIYQSLIQGARLYDMWPRLSKSNKKSICKSLGSIQTHLRQLRPDTGKAFVGSITGGEIHDRFSCLDGGLAKPAGPFETVKSFNDWVQLAALPTMPLSQRAFEDPYRPLLPDTGNIYFSHGDFHFGNIMVSQHPGKPVVVTGVIDWEEAGWYPSYWEFCKMATVMSEEEVFKPEYMDTVILDRSKHKMAWGAVAEYW